MRKKIEMILAASDENIPSLLGAEGKGGPRVDS